jgi:hypothetical protein
MSSTSNSHPDPAIYQLIAKVNHGAVSQTPGNHRAGAAGNLKTVSNLESLCHPADPIAGRGGSETS